MEPEGEPPLEQRQMVHGSTTSGRAQSVVDLEGFCFRFPAPAGLEGVKHRNKVILKLESVSFQYLSNAGPAIANVSLMLSQASRVVLSGAKGAGKSTLMKVIAGDLQPSEGTLLKVQDLYVAYASRNAVQCLDLHLHHTPAEYMLSLFDSGHKQPGRKEGHLAPGEVERHLADFGLDSKTAVTQIDQLSGGMKARLALATVMFRRPQVLILDEFVECLEASDVGCLILAVRQYAGGVIVISENAGFCESVGAERWHLGGGSLRAEGHPACGLSGDVGAGKKQTEAVPVTTPLELKRHIHDIERRINDAKTRPVAQRELRELHDELISLKEILLRDVRLQDPDCPKPDDYPLPGLGQAIDEQLSELLMEEFGADLPNFRRTQQEFGLKLSLLVEQIEEPSEGEPLLGLIGFLAYKTWGAPEPCVSVGAVGVAAKYRGKGYGRDLMRVAEDRAALLDSQRAEGAAPAEVRLRSLASAVRFYERLGYERVEEGLGEVLVVRPLGCPDAETSERGEPEDDEDAPCVPMRKRCAPLSLRTAAVQHPLSPKQDPWSPRQSRALEDGPTWPSRSTFLLPASHEE